MAQMNHSFIYFTSEAYEEFSDTASINSVEFWLIFVLLTVLRFVLAVPVFVYSWWCIVEAISASDKQASIAAAIAAKAAAAEEATRVSAEKEKQKSNIAIELSSTPREDDIKTGDNSRLDFDLNDPEPVTELTEATDVTNVPSEVPTGRSPPTPLMVPDNPPMGVASPTPPFKPNPPPFVIGVPKTREVASTPAPKPAPGPRLAFSNSPEPMDTFIPSSTHSSVDSAWFNPNSHA